MADRGHRVLVLTGLDGPDDRHNGSDVLRLLKVPPWTGHQPRTLKSVFRQVNRRQIFRRNKSIANVVAAEFQPDVVLIWQFEGIGIGLAQELQMIGRPVVYNVEDYLLCDSMTRLRTDPNLLWRLGRRWIYGVRPHALDTSELIFASEGLKNDYIASGFVSPQMTVIHNGIDSKYISKHYGSVGSGRRLLYAGRIDPVKGVDIAIKALANLNSEEKSRFSLDIVGEGPAEYVEKLQSLARSLEISELLRFVGPKDREALMKLYQEYDILLFPSVCSEAFGMTVIEAMARGVPVIASERGGPTEIITHMEDGLLVEPENPSAFAQGVRLLCNRPGLRKRMGEKAIAKVRSKFTLERNVAQVEELLHRVICSSACENMEGASI